MADYPHCDSRILHAPKTCDYCDKYPEYQCLRVLFAINFTGQHHPDKKPCPADIARPNQSYNNWGGNTPKKSKPRLDNNHDSSQCFVCQDDTRRMEAICNPEEGIKHGYSYPEPGIPFIISPRISIWIARIQKSFNRVFR